MSFRRVILSRTDNFNLRSRPGHRKKIIFFQCHMGLSNFSLYWLRTFSDNSKFSFYFSITWHVVRGWFIIMMCLLQPHLVVPNKFQFWLKCNKSWKASEGGVVKDFNDGAKESDISSTLDTSRAVLSAWQNTDATLAIISWVLSTYSHLIQTIGEGKYGKGIINPSKV